MANKKTSMSKVRQVIKLFSQRMGKKKIAERLGMSKHTVKHYVELYNRLKIPWDELSKYTDFDLDKLFHPPQETPLSKRLEHLYDFFPVMEKQLRRRGMTVSRQFREFIALHPDTYAETSFYGYYNKWK